jgi:hypothetical protein
LNVRGRKVRIARNTLSYTAHFLAPDDSVSEAAHSSSVYSGLVDEFENDEENADLPEIAYFWD